MPASKTWSSRPFLAACLLTTFAGAAQAQYIGPAPPPPPPLAPGAHETPSASLARNVRLLALSPQSFDALIGAGRAALDLGDTQAAIGFFGRAEDVRPNDPGPKVGLGAATVEMGDAPGALAYFSRAQQLGANGAMLGNDRGLARDLIGDQRGAQADYRAAFFGPEPDEAHRRLALSLGISRDRAGALVALQPLLQRHDPAAERTRAFVLALTGDLIGARQAIDVAMPGSSGRIEPFFRKLALLRNEQKAAAVHLGVFPKEADIAYAPPPPPIQVATQVAQAPVRQTRNERKASRRAAPPALADSSLDGLRPVTSLPSERSSRSRRVPTVTSTPPVQIASVMPRSAPIYTPPVSQPAAVVPQVTPPVTPPVASATLAPSEPLIADPASVAPSATPGFSLPSATPISTVGEVEPLIVNGDRLSGIDRLLAASTDVAAPAEIASIDARSIAPATGKVDKAAAAKKGAADAKKAAADKKTASDKKAAADKIAADKKAAADAKKAADAKAKEESSLGVAGKYWVQLAGGQNEDRMAAEYRRVKAKKASLFAGHPGLVTRGKDYYRLLAGPFDTSAEAQTYVTQLDKAGIDGFVWTRTPATIRIEKLPAK